MKNEIMFRSIKKELAAHYGREAAEAIWQRAEAESDRLVREYPDLIGDGQNMWTVGAIYLALREHDPENALPLLCECGRTLGRKFRKIVHSLTSIPGLPELLWKHMPGLMESMSSEKKGYRRRIASRPPEMVGVDILSCPIHEAAKQMGIPEAATIVCAMDKEYMTGFRRIDYTRTASVAEGGACCDYRLSYNKNKR